MNTSSEMRLNIIESLLFWENEDTLTKRTREKVMLRIIIKCLNKIKFLIVTGNR